MRKITNLVSIVVLATLCHAAQGEDFMFTCITPRGSTVAGSRPSDDCKGRDVNVIDSTGKVVLIVRDPISPEERRARDAEDDRIRREEWEEWQWCRKMPDAPRCLPKAPPVHRDPAVADPIN